MDFPSIDQTPINVAAVAAHEVYCALIRAGFTDAQALTITIGLIQQTINPGKE